ncbi:MAG: RNA polymerase sigma factor [Planctomycetota bacterium]|jgi:RNA polymerase sigma-70 factor (ECF subfamily)
MKEDVSGLIKSAIAGDQQSMNDLVQRVQPRIRAYILRSTLNEDLTEDIVQETMLQLLSSLKTLTNTSRFWPWLYRIANNKKISHFRKANRHPVHFSSIQEHLLESAMHDECDEISDGPALKELHGMILKTMEKLTHSERSILSLRCFENMPYNEIAEINGYAQTTARVQFLRARKKLKSNLVKQGLSRKAVLPALVLFGKFTADEAVAGTVTASSVSLTGGMTATQTVIATVKVGLVKYVTATAAAATITALGHTAWVQTHPHPYPPRDTVQSVHYTVQGIGLLDESDEKVAARPNNRSRKGDVDDGPYYSKGAYEQYLHFPEGPDGPVLVRMQRWELDPRTHQNTGKLCSWLQNGKAHYYFFAGPNRIYITNDPVGMLVLPTDSPEMVDFLLAHSSYQDNVLYSRDRKTGLIKNRKDRRVQTVGSYKTEYAYNSLTEGDFEPFWPEVKGTVDERDAMHYRGWTYVTIEGNLGEMTIQGQARIPFSYAAWKEHKPWLDITIGDKLHLIDTADGACLIDESAGTQTTYPAETFFTGLGRPWIGIRAYDTLRRDAARERIPFKNERKDETATVSLTRQVGKSQYEVKYTIDMLTDIITQIDLTNGDTQGQLTLTYVQDNIEAVASHYQQPSLPMTTVSVKSPQTSHWLMGLLKNSDEQSVSNIMLTRR